MKFKEFLSCGVAAASLIAGGANAATINLVGINAITNPGAKLGFQIAANYWASMFTNTAVINLGVAFGPLPPNVIGSTGSRHMDYSLQNYENRIDATKSNSKLDQGLVLPTLTTGGASFIANGVDANDDQQSGDDYKYFINGDQTSAKTLYTTSSVVKAIGGTVASPNTNDGNVTFSSTFPFDFNPANGVTAGTFDFIGVAIHEIGHALGFVSGVDLVDYYSYPNGPGRGGLGYNFNDTSLFSALDMFRYSADPTNVAPGAGPSLDLTVGGTKYFSIDGGATALFGNTFATGSFNGDGRQASHWKDTPACQVGNGIMDPTFCFGQAGVVTALDLAAFDAMGWNLSVDALGNHGSYSWSTGQIFYGFGGAVPEPATWAMMIAGFGLVGGAMRRRATRVSFA